MKSDHMRNLIILVVLMASGGPANAADASRIKIIYSDEKRHIDYAVDLNSIKRGEDGLIYYTSLKGLNMDTDNPIILESSNAVDCQARILYTLANSLAGEVENWRSKGDDHFDGTVGELEYKLVCKK